MPLHLLRVLGFLVCVVFFVGVAFCAEGGDSFSRFFQIIYQWEPLQESEGVLKAVADTSDRPQDVLQEEDLLAFVVRERTLVLVDLAAQEVPYEREFPKKRILHGLHRGYITYYLEDESKTHVLSIAHWGEKTFPGTLVCATHEGFVVTRDRDVLY